MTAFETIMHFIFGGLLILSALGVLLARKPVHACLSFLVTLLTLATLYLQLSAQFLAVMQILVYAGAILVIFMFVIVLFQDAHHQLAQFQPKSKPFLLLSAVFAILLSFIFLAGQFSRWTTTKPASEGFGTVQALGYALYVDYFFPFEAVIFLFLISVIGALYTAKKDLPWKQ